jgi:hypothetical protein
MINQFYQDKINKDRENIENRKYLNLYKNILESFETLKKGHFILRIGKGSGQNFLSVDNPLLRIPITKSIVGNAPLGWCRFEYVKG